MQLHALTPLPYPRPAHLTPRPPPPMRLWLQLRGVQQERDALHQELRAVSQDLEALVRENQVGQGPRS